MHERTVPAAQEKRRRQHRDGEHVHVFGEEEKRKLHRTVFSVKPGDQLSFGLRQIEWHAVSFGDCRGQIDEEPQRLHPKQIPTGDAQMT